MSITLSPARRRLVLCALSLVLLSLSPRAPLSAAQEGVTLGGQLYTEAAIGFGDGAAASYGGSTVFKLNLSAAPSEFARVDAAGLVALSYGDSAAQPVQPRAEVSKLFLSIYTDYADILAGRQIINYGRGTMFSPVDIFTAVDPIDLSRTGTDALRVKVPFGALSGLELVSTVAKPLADETAGLRLYGNLAGWNFAAAGFWDGGAASVEDSALDLAFDCKGDLFFGVSGEALVRVPYNAAAAALDSGAAEFQGMVGLDYSLWGALFLDVEYLWKSSDASHSLFGSVSGRIGPTLILGAHGGFSLESGFGKPWIAGSAAWTFLRGATVTAFVRYFGADALPAGEPWTVGARLQVLY